MRALYFALEGLIYRFGVHVPIAVSSLVILVAIQPRS